MKKRFEPPTIFSISGPGAGPRGGEIVAQGTLAEVLRGEEFADGGLPFRPGADRHPTDACRAAIQPDGRGMADGRRRRRKQSKGCDRVVPDRLFHLRDRRLRQRQVHFGG